MRSRHLPVALLGDRQDRTSALLDGAEVRLSAADVPVLRLDAATVTRRAMLEGMGSGIGVAIYTGHGTPLGWPTYGGVRPRDLVSRGGRPVPALVLLTCHGASYAQELVDLGIARTVIAAEGEVSHERNVELLKALVATLTKDRVDSPVDLMSAAVGSGDTYSTFGDPRDPIR